jgi:2-dehydropantoate 2-reductase
MKNKILIIGTGALGGFYGALLAKAGAEVSVVCHSEYEYVKQNGININSSIFGNWTFTPSQVLQKPEDYSDTADFVLLCTKVIPSLDRVALIKPAMKPGTTLVFIQNGVEIEQELVLAYPEHEIISGLAYICCNRISKGHLLHSAYGRLTLGSLTDSATSKIENLITLFKASKLECFLVDNIIAERWKKCVWNAAFNPVSVLSGGLLTLSILQSQESLVRQLMNEICLIASATGHQVSDDIIDLNIANTYAIDTYKTSMLEDFEHGRPMETEAILGNALLAAKKVGIDSPHLETVYRLMKLRELKLTLP